MLKKLEVIPLQLGVQSYKLDRPIPSNSIIFYYFWVEIFLK